MADEIPISGLPSVTAAALTDIKPVVQSGTTYQETNQQVLTLFNDTTYGYIEVNDGMVVEGVYALTNPCPSLVIVNFTVDSNAIRLPPANTVNYTTAGKPIRFVVIGNPLFDVQLSDGSVLLSNITEHMFEIAFTTNSTANGTPVITQNYVNSIGPQSKTGNVTLALSDISDAGTVASQDANNINFSGGVMDNIGITDGSITGNFDFVAINSANPIGFSGAPVSMACDLFVSNGTGGVSRTFSIDNSSTTGGDNATVMVRTTGSGGDPVTRHSIIGVQDYVMGIDNSDSDAFVRSIGIALGTSNYERVASTGEITHPLQPAFLAYLSATASNVTGNGATYTLIADTEIYDQNNDYNNSTGVFIAPVTGRYLFILGITYSQLDSTSTAGNIQLTSSNRAGQLFSGNYGAVRDSANNFVISQCMPMDMDAGDAIAVTTTISGMVANSVDVVGTSGTLLTYFGGYLIC